FEPLVKDQLAQQLGFCTATQFDVFHLTVDVPFLVGEEEVYLTAAADQRLPFEPLQALSDVPTQGQTVSVDLIQAERHEVLDGALHFLDVADQEEHLQQLHIERFQAEIVFGLIDRALDRRVQETLDGWIKRVQGHQDLNFLVRDSDTSRLKGIQNGAFASRQVQPRGTGLANGLENALHQLELVRCKG